MPFERYLNAPSDREGAVSDQEHTPYDSSGSTIGRQDATDHPIFSNNVQFQMPQLMLGPTLPPGGGAEVLPAGIVGNANAVASTWLASSPTFPRSTHDYWMLPPQEPMPISQTVVLPSYFPSSVSSLDATHSRPISYTGTGNPTSMPSSSATPSGYPDVPDFAHPHPPLASLLPMSIPMALPLPVPNAGGLPVYSTSGFDLLSILARVVTRPNPKIALGPVDMTCSFIVVDVRRYDNPVVYASPTFYKLTGYPEHEVLGRNCRFLQSPDGNVQRGEQRRHTAPEAVAHMRKSLAADKECQVSLINYRKDGSAFVNLVTVIPLRGGVHNLPEEADEVVYQVGFQVDLTEQPNAILQKLRDGSYMVNYSNNTLLTTATSSKPDWRAGSSAGPGVSKSLRALLNNSTFLDSIPFSTSTTTLSLAPQDRNEKTEPHDGNKPLSLMLLETSPDFVQVLSLKGAFLYVSPSVRRIIGYEPEDLVGKSVTDFCHEADKVPLVRELKESSALLPPAVPTETSTTSQHTSYSNSAGPRVVDLLFRMRMKDSSYVWLECRGRLYVEPGKGRKAIILSGRVRSMASLTWGPIARAGGLAPTYQCAPLEGSNRTSQEQEEEFWALLSSGGSFLFVGAAVRDLLGWGSGEVIGRSLGDLVGGHDPLQGRMIVEETLNRAFMDSSLETRNVSCELQRKDGSQVAVEIIFYHPSDDQQSSSAASSGVGSRPLVCQVKLSSSATSPSSPAKLVHGHAAQVFDEFDVARESSWQYELQQLKFVNQRLREEVEALELHVQQEKGDQARTRSVQEHSLLLPQTLGNAWANHLQNMSHHVRATSKRTWDGDMVGYSG